VDNSNTAQGIWQLVGQNGVPYRWIAAGRDPADSALGASFEPVEEGVRAQLGLDGKTGLVISAIAEGGPAASSGLKQNDILLTLAEAPLAKADDLPKQLKAAGEKDVPLKLLREGKPLTLRIRPVTRMTLGPAEPEKVDYYIGVSASPPDDILRAHVKLPDGQGLLITEVVPQSPAEKSGVKKYDILLKLDDKPLDRPENLAQQVQAVGGKPATLFLYRAGKPITISVQPEPRKPSADQSAYREAVRLWTADGAVLNALTAQKGEMAKWNVNPQVQHLFTHKGFTPLNQGGSVPYIVNPAASEATTAQRLDKLEKEIQALETTLKEIRDALKKGK
jgi:membrane-associated protease RseP (regulator of RpoE activity)